MLRDRPATVTGIGFLDVGGGTAWRCLEQFLQEGGLAAPCRRLARFEILGHTPGRMDVVPVRRTAEFPFTLDLRRIVDPSMER